VGVRRLRGQSSEKFEKWTGTGSGPWVGTKHKATRREETQWEHFERVGEGKSVRSGCQVVADG